MRIMQIESDSANRYKYIGNTLKVYWSIPLAIFLLTIFQTTISAQVVINEFSSSTSDDWIELFAYENTDISGWILDDDGTATDMKEIPSDIIIGPSSNQFYVVEVSNRLNNGGDILILLKPDRSEVDRISYGDKGGVCTPSELGSIGRYPDANSTIERFKTALSKGSSNNTSELDPCPTPTPEPTDSPTPTTKPTNTPTSKPTSTSVPTSKPKATSTVAPTISEEDSQETGEGQTLKVGSNGINEVLGIKDVGKKESKAADEEVEKKFPFFALIPILLGVGLIGSSFYYFLRQRKKEYNS